MARNVAAKGLLGSWLAATARLGGRGSSQEDQKQQARSRRGGPGQKHMARPATAAAWVPNGSSDSRLSGPNAPRAPASDLGWTKKDRGAATSSLNKNALRFGRRRRFPGGTAPPSHPHPCAAIPPQAQAELFGPPWTCPHNKCAGRPATLQGVASNRPRAPSVLVGQPQFARHHSIHPHTLWLHLHDCQPFAYLVMATRSLALGCPRRQRRPGRPLLLLPFRRRNRLIDTKKSSSKQQRPPSRPPRAAEGLAAVGAPLPRAAPVWIEGLSSCGAVCVGGVSQRSPPKPAEAPTNQSIEGRAGAGGRLKAAIGAVTVLKRAATRWVGCVVCAAACAGRSAVCVCVYVCVCVCRDGDACTYQPYRDHPTIWTQARRSSCACGREPPPAVGGGPLT